MNKLLIVLLYNHRVTWCSDYTLYGILTGIAGSLNAIYSCARCTVAKLIAGPQRGLLHKTLSGVGSDTSIFTVEYVAIIVCFLLLNPNSASS